MNIPRQRHHRLIITTNSSANSSDETGICVADLLNRSQQVLPRPFYSSLPAPLPQPATYGTSMYLIGFSGTPVPPRYPSLMLLISCDPALYPTLPSYGLFLPKPVPVGEFSVDEQRTQHLGRSRVRYLYEDPIDCIDLTDGMETFVTKDFYAEGIDQILRWITRMAVPRTFLKKTIHECDFVVWRGTLTHLLSSPYAFGSHYDVGIKIACVKYKGVYFLREFDTQTSLLRESNRSYYEREACYAGHKFEQICTTAKLGGKPYTRALVNQNNEFIGMFKATLNPPSNHPRFGLPKPTRAASALPFRLLYAAEIDCVSKEGEYMEIKTQNREFGFGRGFADKALKWWIQSYLAGIEKLVIGVHENFVLNRIEIHQLNSLPRFFERQMNTATCFAFLYSFLETVKRYLDAGSGRILVVERQPNSSEFDYQYISQGSAQAAEYRVFSEEFKAHGWK